MKPLYDWFRPKRTAIRCTLLISFCIAAVVQLLPVPPVPVSAAAAEPSGAGTPAQKAAATAPLLTASSAAQAAATPTPRQTGLVLPETAGPAELRLFVKETVAKLAASPPFTGWSGAELKIYPLGPGTHGWLVNVMRSGERIGYLIIAAKTDGGYMLSEYGAGTEGLPYSLTELRRVLAQDALIPTSSIPRVKLEAVYVPLRPLWKLTDPTGSVYYLHAWKPELLPRSAAEQALNQLSAPIGAINRDWTPAAAGWTAGAGDDPAADLSWLAEPPLTIGAAVSSSLSDALRRSPLVFRSRTGGGLLAAPFILSGAQRWTALSDQPGGERQIEYAALPNGTSVRFVPLGALLREEGGFHPLPSGEPAPLPQR